jgi:hypothetical protein
MSARGFMGSGDIYINRIVGGVKLGMDGPYFANKFEIKPNVDKKQLESKGRNSRGQVIESVSVQKPAEFTLELNEVNKESMILALLGTEASRTQTAGSLTAVDFVAKLGKWVPLSKQALTAAALTVTNSGASTTYVEGTDYEVNRQLGWIRALATGSIVADAPLKVTAAYGAIAGAVISGATNTDIRAEIVFDGINEADKLPVIVTIREAIIAADSAFDFLADDFNTVNLPGTMKTPTGAAEPFTVELRTTLL